MRSFKIKIDMKAITYRKNIEKKIKNRNDITIKYQNLYYWFWTYKIGSISSKKRWKNRKTLYIRAGIHWEEIAWPLTILDKINQIINYANKKNVNILIHPLANPAGFEKKTRYSDIKNPPKNGNNDVIIYQLSNGNYSDDIGEINTCKNRYRSNEKTKKLPPESIFAIKEFKKNIKNQNIVGILDIHQDYITPRKEAFAYQYGFWNTNIYNPIITNIKNSCKLYKNKNINAGFNNKVTKKWIKSDWIWITSDKNWRIIRHDWTLWAAAEQLWIPYNVTCETTGVTPYKIAKKINMLWIYWLIDLISEKK